MTTHETGPAPGSGQAPHPGGAASRPKAPPKAAPKVSPAAHPKVWRGRLSAAAGATGRGTRRVAGATRRGTRRVAGGGSRAGRATWTGLRRLTHAQGAGESGLGRVIELHLVASIADALIVTALASTIFFAVPTEEARGRVATSLLVTMVPFTLLAPVIGPLLDRVRRGRRYALATTMVVRAFLAWVMAGSIHGATGSDAAFGLYPAAFGFLVCQKAYIVTRAAALPRVLPRGTGLVAANSRISLAGVAALGIGGGIGTGLTAWAGPSWTLRLAFVVFVAGTALALALPGRIDSGEGEVDARMSSERQRTGTGGHPLIAELAKGSPTTPAAGTAGTAGTRVPRWSIGPVVVLGLRANAAVRAFTGFLTLFLAFQLRDEPLTGFSGASSVVLVVVLAAVGGGIGNGLGAALRRIRPEGVVVLVLALIAVACAWAAIGYGPWAVGAVALVAGTAQALGKLCLDAMIQTEVPERVRTSAFARSETVLQLAWVIGGGAGIVLPLSGPWGLGLAALATAAMTGFTATTLTRLAR